MSNVRGKSGVVGISAYLVTIWKKRKNGATMPQWNEGYLHQQSNLFKEKWHCNNSPGKSISIPLNSSSAFTADHLPVHAGSIDFSCNQNISPWHTIYWPPEKEEKQNLKYSSVYVSVCNTHPSGNHIWFQARKRGRSVFYSILCAVICGLIQNHLCEQRVNENFQIQLVKCAIFLPRPTDNVDAKWRQ